MNVCKFPLKTRQDMIIRSNIQRKKNVNRWKTFDGHQLAHNMYVCMYVLKETALNIRISSSWRLPPVTEIH